MKYSLTIFLALFLLASCGKKDKAKPEDSNPGGKDIVATIELPSGDKADIGYNYPNNDMLKPSLSYKKGENYSIFIASAGVTIKGTTYSLNIMAGIDGKGTYSFDENFDQDNPDQTGVNITLTKMSDPVEIFLSVYVPEEKIGAAELTITSLTDDHIKATFSATLYSVQTGERATVKNGKLDSKMHRREVE